MDFDNTKVYSDTSITDGLVPPRNEPGLGKESTDELLLIIKSILDILKYIPRDKRQDLAPYNCAQHFRVAYCFNIFLIWPFLFSQAGWWFNYCYYALLTATSVGPESTYETSPYLVWQLGAYAYGTSWRNWYKYSQAKFTLKLK